MTQITQNCLFLLDTHRYMVHYKYSYVALPVAMAFWSPPWCMPQAVTLHSL